MKQTIQVDHGDVQHLTNMLPLERLVSNMHVTRVSANTTIYQESSQITHFYYIKSGMVKLRKFTAQGDILTLSLLKVGDFFGDWSHNHETIHFTNAETSTTCDLGIISIQELNTILKQDPELMLALLDFIHTNYMIMQSKLRDLLLFGKLGALSSLLIRLSHTFGNPLNSNQYLIDKKFTHFEMAEMIGTSRESVSRMLSEMKQQGAVDWTDQQIIIKDLAHLRMLSQCENCSKSICRM